MRGARPEDAELRPFPEAESAPPEARTTLRPGGFERAFDYDVASDTMTYTSISDSGLQRIDAIGLELEEIARKVYRIRGDDPLSADNSIHWTMRRARGDWQVRIETRTRMRATRERFPDRRRARCLRGRSAGVLPQLARHDPARSGVRAGRILAGDAPDPPP